MTPQYVKLKSLDRILHFGPALFLGFAFLIILVSLTIKGRFDIEILTVLGLIFSIPTAIFYAIQKNKLQFNFIKVSINENEFKDLVTAISKEYRWTIDSQANNEFTLKTNPGFINQSWGQHITLKLTRGGILLNSIFDTNKGTSLVTFGSNTKNINDITRIIEQMTKGQLAK
jgi:hypothetical protein